MSAQTPSQTVQTSQVESTGPCSRKLSIRISAERVDGEFESTLKNVMSSVHFQGFRPGKAPRRLVEARLGDRVLGEVKERLVQTAVESAIAEHKLQPVGNPRMDFDAVTVRRGQEFTFDVTLDVRPEFTLPKLEDVVVRKPDLTVTEAQVDAAVESLRMERSTTSDGGDEPCREHGILTLAVKIAVGDAVVVDASDVEWQLGTDVLGGMAITGLSAGILGKKKGEEGTFTQALPADFRDEQYRGKDATITIRVDGVQHVTLPAADDAFAKEMDYEDTADMRAELRKKLEREAAANEERALDEAIVDALLAAVPFDVPPSLVNSETERMLRRYEMQLRQQGVPDQEIALALQQMVAAAATKVTRDLRASFLLERVASERKVFVTETEMRQEIGRIAARYSRSANDMEEQLASQQLLGALRTELRERKTVAELRGLVKIEGGTSEAAAKA
jgi:trigger factor